jgi:fumarate hydratase class II
VIGYAAGAALVKEALARNVSIRQVALEKVEAGTLRHVREARAVRADEIETALGDLRRLTEGGIAGVSGGG